MKTENQRCRRKLPRFGLFPKPRRCRRKTAFSPTPSKLTWREAFRREDRRVRRFDLADDSAAFCRRIYRTVLLHWHRYRLLKAELSRTRSRTIEKES